MIPAASSLSLQENFSIEKSELKMCHFTISSTSFFLSSLSLNLIFSLSLPGAVAECNTRIFELTVVLLSLFFLSANPFVCQTLFKELSLSLSLPPLLLFSPPFYTSFEDETIMA